MAGVWNEVIVCEGIVDSLKKWCVKTVVELAAEDGDPISLGGQLVELGLRDPLDETLCSKFSQIVAKLGEGVMGTVQGALDIAQESCRSKEPLANEVNKAGQCLEQG